MDILNSLTSSVIKIKRQVGRFGTLVTLHEQFLAFERFSGQLSTLGDKVKSSFIRIQITNKVKLCAVFFKNNEILTVRNMPIFVTAYTNVSVPTNTYF